MNKSPHLPPPTMTGDVWQDLNDMHDYFGFHDKPMTRKQLKQRIEFCQEEINETREAFEKGNADDVLDGLIDMIVVAVGTIDLLGCHGVDAWRAVMVKNCQKQVGHNDSRPDSDGKDLIKPEGWERPVLIDYVSGHANEIISNLELVEDNLVVARSDREAIHVLEACIEMCRRKSDDYNFPGSTVQPADYYPRGIDDLVYMIDVTKRHRQTSILDKMRAGLPPHFEGLIDTLMDRIIYLAIAVEWLRYMMVGQRKDHDIFNQPTDKSKFSYELGTSRDGHLQIHGSEDNQCQTKA